MTYFKDLESKMDRLLLWMDLAKEQGADVSSAEAELSEYIDRMVDNVRSLPPVLHYP